MHLRRVLRNAGGGAATRCGAGLSAANLAAPPIAEHGSGVAGLESLRQSRPMAETAKPQGSVERYVQKVAAGEGCTCRQVRSLDLRETFQGETVWEGEVLEFELLGHPTAPRCYGFLINGEPVVVLHEPPVGGPRDAVRLAIADPQTRSGE